MWPWLKVTFIIRLDFINVLSISTIQVGWCANQLLHLNHLKNLILDTQGLVRCCCGLSFPNCDPAALRHRCLRVHLWGLPLEAKHGDPILGRLRGINWQSICRVRQLLRHILFVNKASNFTIYFIFNFYVVKLFWLNWLYLYKFFCCNDFSFR